MDRNVYYRMYCMYVNTTMSSAFIILLGNKLSELNLVICGTLCPMELKFYMLTIVSAGSISTRCFIFIPTDGSSCSYQFSLQMCHLNLHRLWHQNCPQQNWQQNYIFKCPQEWWHQIITILVIVTEHLLCF